MFENILLFHGLLFLSLHISFVTFLSARVSYRKYILVMVFCCFKVGVAGSFLAEIKPQADGANGLKYNLTPDIIESIFKTYPAVKKKHTENVPTGKLSEQEFWTKFFQSHYFHR